MMMKAKWSPDDGFAIGVLLCLAALVWGGFATKAHQSAQDTQLDALNRAQGLYDPDLTYGLASGNAMTLDELEKRVEHLEALHRGELPGVEGDWSAVVEMAGEEQ